MSDWRPTEQYQRIVEANRQFYSQYASLYDATETCVVDPQHQREVATDLRQILALTGRPPATLRALDACGGSGNIALKLLGLGVPVTLVDVSSELQEIFRRKCETSGLTPQIVTSEIGSFLAQTTQTFDLIVFSSALHHLEDIEQVLTLAFQRLDLLGFLFTVFDPTLRRRSRLVTRTLQRLDYVGFKVFCQSSDLPKALTRRLKRSLAGESNARKAGADLNPATVGMLAEYQMDHGVDDHALVHRLGAVGYRVVWHHRYVETRFRLTRRLIERTGDVTTFKLLLQRPAPAAFGGG